MRVLVTGHEGYLGTLLTPLLNRRGYDVRGLDIGLYRHCSTGTRVPIPALRRDIRDVEREDFDGIDVVIHLAGLSNDPLGDLDPGATEQINLAATMRVGECARGAGVSRLLFASSCSVYGAAGEEFLDEDSVLNPQTPYAACKMHAEQGLSRLANDDLAVTHLRLATVFGASPCIRFDLVVNNLTAWAATTGRVNLKSDGKAWRPVLHVRDVCTAFKMVMEDRRLAIGSNVFNVGDTKANFRVEGLADLVRDAIDGARISYSEQPEPDQRSYRVNCDRFHAAVPSFRARYSVTDGIRDVRDLVARLELAPGDFEGSTYRRSDHLAQLRDSGLVDDAFRWIAPTGAEDLALKVSSE